MQTKFHFHQFILGALHCKNHANQTNNTACLNKFDNDPSYLNNHAVRTGLPCTRINNA